MVARRSSFVDLVPVGIPPGTVQRQHEQWEVIRRRAALTVVHQLGDADRAELVEVLVMLDLAPRSILVTPPAEPPPEVRP